MPTVKAEALYLEECGSACPVCRMAGRIDRRVDLEEPILRIPRDQLPRVILDASCGYCGESWQEVYELKGIATP